MLKFWILMVFECSFDTSENVSDFNENEHINIKHGWVTDFKNPVSNEIGEIMT